MSYSYAALESADTLTDQFTGVARDFMILQRKAAILSVVLSVIVGSGQTCREQSANSSSSNAINGSTPNSVANMSNQNKNEPNPNTVEVVWGGPHVRLVLTSNGGEIEFDCAHGEIREPLKLSEQGRFSVAGTFVREGGPIRS